MIQGLKNFTVSLGGTDTLSTRAWT